MNAILKNPDSEITPFDAGLTPEEFFRSIGLPETVPLETAMDQVLGGMLQVKPENMEKIEMLIKCIAAMKPKSMLEAQLILQMLYCHRESVKMFQRTHKEIYPEGAEKYLNMGVKLLRSFRMGLETLGRYRRDGKQSFYIERVVVERDAQAVIGNLGKGGAV